MSRQDCKPGDLALWPAISGYCSTLGTAYYPGVQLLQRRRLAATQTGWDAVTATPDLLVSQVQDMLVATFLAIVALALVHVLSNVLRLHNRG